MTGGCGFIGSNFMRHVLEHYGQTMITNVDSLTYAGNPANLAGVAEQYGERYEFYKADISDQPRMNALFEKHQFYAVINFAAESHVDRSIDSPGDFIHTNIVGTATLLDAARRHGVRRFLQVSTDEVYGSLGPEGKFTETSPIQPSSPYSSSKAGADLLALAHAPHLRPGGRDHALLEQLRAVSVSRKAHPADDHQRARTTSRCRFMAMGSMCAIGFTWKITARRSFAALLDGKPGEVYNVGSDGEMRNIDVVKMILAHLGKPESLIKYVADRLGHDRRYAIDSIEGASRAGVEAAASARAGHPRDDRLVCGEPRVVGAVDETAERAMKIVVLGSGGRLGAALAREWRAAGDAVTGFNRAAARHRQFRGRSASSSRNSTSRRW